MCIRQVAPPPNKAPSARGASTKKNLYQITRYRQEASPLKSTFIKQVNPPNYMPSIRSASPKSAPKSAPTKLYTFSQKRLHQNHIPSVKSASTKIRHLQQEAPPPNYTPSPRSASTKIFLSTANKHSSRKHAFTKHSLQLKRTSTKNNTSIL